MAYWLLKTEPSTFSIDDLASRPDQTEPWDGVRNYQARTFIRQMRPGDLAFIYHSNANPPGIVGIAEIVSEPRPDPTQFDPQSPYHDPRSDPQAPRWLLVDVRLRRRFDDILPLPRIREHADELEGLQLLARGNRLSVMPVDPAHWRRLCELAGEDPEA